MAIAINCLYQPYIVIQLFTNMNYIFIDNIGSINWLTNNIWTI